MKKMYLKKDVLFIINDRVQNLASFFNIYKLGKNIIKDIGALKIDEVVEKTSIK